MNWFESIIYGFITGLTEFLPISSGGHQQIMLQLFGAPQQDPVRNLLIHLALLVSVYTSCKSLLDHLGRERSMSSSRNKNYSNRSKLLLDYQLVKRAAFPMLLCLFIITYIIRLNNNLLITALFLLLNGVILFIPERLIHGNKDARGMSGFDSILIGICSSLFAFNGISRTGCLYAISTARGVSSKSVLTWSLLLSIPALAAMIVIDIIGLFTEIAIPFWSNLFCYILSAVGAYLGGYLGIAALHLVLKRSNFSGFAFYSWGAALLSFILYLTVA